MKTTELTVKKNKGANITAWILQGLLAAMFIMAGTMKTITPIEQLSLSLPWTSQVPTGLVRFIGLAELLGGLGLILPSLLRIKPKLTPITAMGLIIVMIAASIFHITRGEFNVIGMNIILAALAGVVAWLRLKKAPIQSKASK